MESHKKHFVHSVYHYGPFEVQQLAGSKVAIAEEENEQCPQNRLGMRLHNVKLCSHFRRSCYIDHNDLMLDSPLPFPTKERREENLRVCMRQKYFGHHTSCWRTDRKCDAVFYFSHSLRIKS